MDKSTSGASPFGLDDDDEWQSMPVETTAPVDDIAKPDPYANPGDLPYGDEDEESSDPDDPRRFQSWPSRSEKGSTPRNAVKGAPPAKAKAKKGSWLRSRFASGSTTAAAAGAGPSTASGSHTRAQSATNATGRHLNIDDARGYDWRSKPAGTSSDSDEDDELGKEKGYTQLRLDEDDESEQLHAATEYLFQDGSGGINGRHDPYGESTAATPLNQMKTTKQLLSEGQKIAYVGLCSLAAAGLVRQITRVPGKELASAKESSEGWKVKVMARLYQHMDIEPSEQSMIESLATHGVLPTDLAPSLITTQTIQNPEFDPEALKERQEEEREERELQAREDTFKREREEERTRAEQQARVDREDPSQGSQDAAKAEASGTIASQDEPQQDTAPRNVDKDGPSARRSGEERLTLDGDADVDIGASVKGDDPTDVDAEADIVDSGDIGDLGRAETTRMRPRSGSRPKAKVERRPVEDADGFDGDIGALAADDSGSDALQISQDDETSTRKRTAQEVAEVTSDASPESAGLASDAKSEPEKPEFDAATPKAKPVELAPPAGSEEEAADPAVGADAKTSGKTILADPNTASQLGNAIDATAALQPASGAAGATDANTTTLGLTRQPEALEPPPGALDGVTTSISSADETITLDLRWTVLCDLFLVLTADSVYDARSRALLEVVASYLGLTWMDVTKFEKRITDALEIEEGVESLKDTGALDRRTQMARKKRIMMVGLATVGGGLVIGLSAGLLAPVIGAGVGAALGAVGISGTSGFLGGVGGAALITTTGTVGGMSLGGRGMSRRTRSVKTFEFKSIHNNKRVNAIVTVPGFMSGPQDDVRLPFSVIDSIMGDVFSVLWEPDMMQEMGNALGILWNETLVQGVQQVLAATVAGAMFSALAWPLWLTKLGYLIDNPWSNALDRAQAAGLILADILSRRQLGVRPITLVGYSLGARAIFYCLVELSRMKAYGIVQNVYIMGAPVTAKDETWKEARSVVAGRFVSAFSRTDWILGYLHRAASGGLRSIAGLHPVERVQEIENVDVTHVVPGHLQYRALMPLVLSELGFKTTADYFDEPEDLTKVPERQVVREDSEYELKTVQTQSGGFGKIWKRKGKGAVSSSSNASPSQTQPGTPQNGQASDRQSYEYDDDDDDLPPRYEPPSAEGGVEKGTPAEKEQQPQQVPGQASANSTAEPAASRTRKPVPAPISIAKAQAAAMDDPRPQTVATPEADKPSSRGVHFDTDAILEELRESGIEVRELESSLPPLVATTSSQPSVVPFTPTKSKGGLELPSAASSADKTPSPSAGKAAIESAYQAPSPSTPSSRRGSSTNDSLPFSESAAAKPRAPAPYARSFSTSSGVASPHYAEFPLPSAAPESAGATSSVGGVSLSFASYDDDEIEAPTPITEERSRSYGLSSETARELEAKFRGGGGGGGIGGGGIGTMDLGPLNGSSGGLGGGGGGGGGGGWGSVPTAPWDRPAGSTPDFEAATAPLSGGFAASLAPPSQTFGTDTIKSNRGFGGLDESFLSAATSSSAARREGSASTTSANLGSGSGSGTGAGGVDPWADNPWGGGSGY